MAKKKTIKVAVPAPTAWPLVAAMGMSLTFAGFLTSWPIGAIGFILCMIGFIGWFRNCYPHDVEFELEVLPHHIPSEVSTLRKIDKEHPHHRARLPLKIPRIRAGVAGGIAGGIAMFLVAMIGSLILRGDIWYPFNVLSATVLPSITESDLSDFNGMAFIIAIVIHFTISICIGLVYGVLLPLMPRHPVLLGTLCIPFIWSFLLFESMSIVNPLLDATVNWWWFLFSQIVFGIVAGFVVAKAENIRTLQFKSFAERIGIEEDEQ